MDINLYLYLLYLWLLRVSYDILLQELSRWLIKNHSHGEVVVKTWEKFPYFIYISNIISNVSLVIILKMFSAKMSTTSNQFDKEKKFNIFG